MTQPDYSRVRSLTAREILAAADAEHAFHTAVSAERDIISCSCGAQLPVTEDAAVRLGVEHRETLKVLKMRLPGKVKA